jgi:hypothetical protein
MGVDIAADGGDLALDLEGTRQDWHDNSGLDRSAYFSR